MFLSRRCCVSNPKSFRFSSTESTYPLMKLAFIIAKTPHRLIFFRHPSIHHFQSTRVLSLDIVNWSGVHIFLGLNRQTLPRNDEFLLTIFSGNKFPVAHVVSVPRRRPNFMIERAFLLSLVVFVDASWVEARHESALHLGMREMATRAGTAGSVSAEGHSNRRAI